MSIKVFCIAKSKVDDDQLREWFDHIGATSFELPLSGNTDAEDLVGVAAKRCYMSFEPGLNPNVNKVRSDWCAYLDNILKSGHGSVLEHATYTFAIENCTRVFTAEMNRHRAGVAISEASLRYIRIGDEVPFWMPTSLDLSDEEKRVYGYTILTRRQDDLDECVEPANLNDNDFELWQEASRKTRTRGLFEAHLRETAKMYRQLEVLWDIDSLPFNEKKKLTSMFRRILPLGISVGAVYTLNLRALRHIIALRTSEHAEEEIALVLSMIGKHMVEHEPKLFGDFAKDTMTGAWVPEYSKV